MDMKRILLLTIELALVCVCVIDCAAQWSCIVTEEDPALIETDFKLSEPDGHIGGHSYIDLGLPSGVKWATYNVRASSPEESGDYFASAETSPKPAYYYDDYLTYHKRKSDLRSAGIINRTGNLTPAHDAARVNWDEGWRIPSSRDFQDLKNLCKWTRVREGGLDGYMVTGPNGHSIFFPFSRARTGEDISSGSKYGYYWTSSIAPGVSDNKEGTLVLCQISPYVGGIKLLDRGRYDGSGYTVRPVSGGADMAQDSEIEGMPPAGYTGGVEDNAPMEDETFYMITGQPEFPGGLEAMYEWIQNEMIYPHEAIEDSAQGRVTVEFVVSKTGEIENPRVVRGRHSALDAEALRIMRKTPKWNPASYYGRPVKSHAYILPIQFKRPSGK